MLTYQDGCGEPNITAGDDKKRANKNIHVGHLSVQTRALKGKLCGGFLISMRSFFCGSYLKDFFIKYSGSKDYDSLGVHDGVGTALQSLGGLLLTVQEEGDGLLVHADGHAMPPGERQETQEARHATSGNTFVQKKTNAVPPKSGYWQDDPE